MSRKWKLAIAAIASTTLVVSVACQLGPKSASAQFEGDIIVGNDGFSEHDELGRRVDGTPRVFAKYVTGVAREPLAKLKTSEIWPMRKDDQRFVFVSGKSASQHDQSHLTFAKDGTWRHNRLGKQIEYLKRDEQGNLFMTRIDDLQNDAIVTFADSLLVLPAVMTPNRPVTSETTVTIYEANDGKTVKAKGSFALNVTYNAVEELTLPAGKFKCHRLVVSSQADLGLGSLTGRSVMYFAPNAGLVAESYDEVVRILISSEKAHWATVRVRKPERQAVAFPGGD